MDNDFRFVCFSPEALKNPVGDVPFLDGLEDFSRNLTEQSLNEFFEGRFRWHWYPILSAGFNSFSIHSDLTTLLHGEKLHEAIGWAALIASREDGRRFIAALALLSFLCRQEPTPKEVPSLTEHFMEIRERVTRNAIDPNISFWFSKIALYQLNSGAMPHGYNGDFDRGGLNAPVK